MFVYVQTCKQTMDVCAYRSTSLSMDYPVWAFETRRFLSLSYHIDKSSKMFMREGIIVPRKLIAESRCSTADVVWLLIWGFLSQFKTVLIKIITIIMMIFLLLLGIGSFWKVFKISKYQIKNLWHFAIIKGVKLNKLNRSICF